MVAILLVMVGVMLITKTMAAAKMVMGVVNDVGLIKLVVKICIVVAVVVMVVMVMLTVRRVVIIIYLNSEMWNER